MRFVAKVCAGSPAPAITAVGRELGKRAYPILGSYAARVVVYDTERRGGTVRCMQGPEYGEVEESVWHDEGGVRFPAWTVVVTWPGHRCCFWFQTLSGAQLFVEERRADTIDS